MITRIHGATSTLAANPRRKHHKRKNPHARRRRNPETVAAEKKKRTLRSAAEQIAALQEKIGKVEDRAKRAQAAAEKRAARPGRRKAGPKAQAAKARRERRKALGISYNMHELPAGAHALSYGYPMYAGLTPKGKKKIKGYEFSSKLSPKTKPRYTLFKTKRGNTHMLKNPGLVIAGVPVIEMAIGSVAAIAAGQALTIVANKYVGSSLPGFLGDKDKGIIGEALTAAVSAYLVAKGPKNPMVKEIAKYAFIGSVFQALSKLAHDPIQSALKSVGLASDDKTVKGMTSGVYFDPYTAAPAVGGYITANGSLDVGGMYTDVSMNGLGLFHAPSIYG